jgi:hypothetical protein
VFLPIRSPVFIAIRYPVLRGVVIFGNIFQDKKEVRLTKGETRICVCYYVIDFGCVVFN